MLHKCQTGPTEHPIDRPHQKVFPARFSAERGRGGREIRRRGGRIGAPGVRERHAWSRYDGFRRGRGRVVRSRGARRRRQGAQAERGCPVSFIPLAVVRPPSLHLSSPRLTKHSTPRLARTGETQGAASAGRRVAVASLGRGEASPSSLRPRRNSRSKKGCQRASAELCPPTRARPRFHRIALTGYPRGSSAATSAASACPPPRSGSRSATTKRPGDGSPRRNRVCCRPGSGSARLRSPTSSARTTRTTTVRIPTPLYSGTRPRPRRITRGSRSSARRPFSDAAKFASSAAGRASR